MKNNLKIRLYKKILKFRMVELEISKEYQNQEMRCPTHLSVGQEAISAAFSEFFKKKDYAVSSHRAHIHYLAKWKFKKMIAEIYGKKMDAQMERWIYAFNRFKCEFHGIFSNCCK